MIIGILAAIAIQKFANTRQKAYAAAMKSDLRNLVAAEESFFADSGSYVTYGDTSKLRFRSSAGVSAPIITLGVDSWSATVTHSQVPNFSCGIAVKTTNAVVATAGNGEPACR